MKPYTAWVWSWEEIVKKRALSYKLTFEKYSGSRAGKWELILIKIKAHYYQTYSMCMRQPAHLQRPMKS